MKNKNTFGGPVLIIIAAVLWGMMGLFVRGLADYGLNSMQIVCIRLVSAVPAFIILKLILEPGVPLPKLRDMPLFIAMGFGSILFFTVCYFTAIRMMSLSAAAVLLYTSPIWVMLMSCLFFREKLTKLRLLALAGSFVGCVLVSGVGGSGLTPTGVLVGLGAGLGYGLYSILGTVALKKYSSVTVTTVVFTVAAIGALLLCLNSGIIASANSGQGIWRFVGLSILSGILTVFIPYLCYTMGLETVDAGKAAIIATVEPLVATVVGVIFYREPLSLASVLGIVFILGSVAILNTRSSR